MKTTITTATPGIAYSDAAADAPVMITGYFYAVDLGENVRPRHHRVGIDGKCTCKLGKDCPSVEQVRTYLADGGKRVTRPPFGFYPVAPAQCPVCGADVFVDQSLSSANRGTGWDCSAGGKSHYWQHRAYISSRRSKLAKAGKVV